MVLLFLLLNPFGFWMPNGLLMIIVLILVVLFTIFASFIWKEKVKDEREAFHRMVADRVAFLVGSGVLVIGIVVQSFKHNINFWLVIALGAMIFAKIVGLIYSRIRH